MLAQNAKAAGINITSDKVDPGTYFARYGKWPFAIDYWVGLPYLVVASIADGPWRERRQHHPLQRPDLQPLYNQASKHAQHEEALEIVHEMQGIQYQRGGYIIWSFQNAVDAYSKKIGGIQPIDKTAWGLGRCQLHKLYFK